MNMKNKEAEMILVDNDVQQLHSSNYSSNETFATWNIKLFLALTRRKDCVDVCIVVSIGLVAKQYKRFVQDLFEPASFSQKSAHYHLSNKLLLVAFSAIKF